MSRTATVLVLLGLGLVTGSVGAVWWPAAGILLGLACVSLGYGIWRSERPETNSE